ncbi:hypothetical protein F5887DRAFT_882138, partial [Amanita rubescens]
EYIHSLLCASSTLKSTHKPNLKNAIIHQKVKELNEGREEGSRLSMIEVQNMVNIEEIMQEITEEEKTELIQQLEDHRELKHKGARATSISAAQDMRCTMQRLTQEADNLASRTGAHIFLFTTRGHVDDRGILGWTATENMEKFFSDVLKIEAWNLLRKFEQWACANDRGGPTSFVLFAMLTVVAGRHWHGSTRGCPGAYPHPYPVIYPHPQPGYGFGSGYKLG